MISKEALLILINETNENKCDLLCNTYGIHKNLIEIMKMIEITDKDLTQNEYDEDSLYEIYREQVKYDTTLDLESLKKMKYMTYIFNYSKSHKEALHESLYRGVDISHLDPRRYRWPHMEEISKGIMNKSDVSHLDPNRYNWMQMQQIRLGLESDSDISHLDPEKYNEKQMEEVRLHLEKLKKN